MADKFDFFLSYVAWIYICCVFFIIGIMVMALRAYMIYINFLEKRTEVKQTHNLKNIVTDAVKKMQAEKLIKREREHILAGVKPEVQHERKKAEEERQTVADETKEMLHKYVNEEQAEPSRIKTHKPQRTDLILDFDYIYDPYMGLRPFYPLSLEATRDAIKKRLEHEEVCRAARQELKDLADACAKNGKQMDHGATCMAAQQELYFYNRKLQKSKRNTNTL